MTEDYGTETGEDELEGGQPLLFREGDDVFLEKGGEAETHLCIKCGKPSTKIVRKALRCPKKPQTWFGKYQRISIGLCPKHAESLMIAKTLTFSLLALGLVFVVFGAITVSISVLVFGLICCAGCGVFRAIVPVSSPNGNDEYAIINGVGDPFKALLPEFQAPPAAPEPPDPGEFDEQE